jgi:hypothetical protein
MHGDGLAVARGVSRYGLRVSEQRARSTAAAEGRSVHPVVAGVPWWGAILIATAATVAGIAIDASSGLRELTHVFAALYLIGCVAAVLAVRQAAIFTAVVQPPLILFIAVPLANYLFHRAEIAGIKDVLINCGYPLIERFPLMLITSLMVLLIGVVRWFLAHTGRPAEAADDWARPFGGITRKVNTLLGRSTNGDDDTRPRRKHTARRRADPPRSAGERRPQRKAASRSRHVRPPTDDAVGPAAAPRRRYADYAPGDGDLPGPPPPSRRRRPQGDTGRRTTPRRRDREPSDPMDPRERPRRVSRYDDLYGGYQPESFDPPQPPDTRHPFSDVRYRGNESGDDNRKYRRPRNPLDSP